MQNDVHISKIKNVLVLKAIFSEITYVCVPGYQISILWDGWGDEFNPNAFHHYHPPPPQLQKRPFRLGLRGIFLQTYVKVYKL